MIFLKVLGYYLVIGACLGLYYLRTDDYLIGKIELISNFTRKNPEFAERYDLDQLVDFGFFACVLILWPLSFKWLLR
jgi:hypothetical protein